MSAKGRFETLIACRRSPTWHLAQAAPTDQLPIVRFDAKAGERSLDLARWGLVPYWSKDINAKDD